MALSTHWIVLLVSVVFEIAWAVNMKFVDLTRPWLIALAVALTATNMVLLSWAMKGIPAGTAYAVWTGLGAIGVTVIGCIALGEPFQSSRLFFLGLVIAGVVGLKATA